MRCKKGEAGYRKYKKQLEILKTIIAFAFVSTLMIVGLVTTKERINILTVVAALGAIPACRMLVELIVRFPYKSISRETAEEVASKTPDITVIYDLIFTSQNAVMPVECIAVSSHTLCGYIENPKVNAASAGEFIKGILAQNGYRNITVKLFDRYPAFLARAEGMNSIAAVEGRGKQKQEQRLADIILNVSL